MQSFFLGPWSSLQLQPVQMKVWKHDCSSLSNKGIFPVGFTVHRDGKGCLTKGEAVHPYVQICHSFKCSFSCSYEKELDTNPHILSCLARVVFVGAAKACWRLFCFFLNFLCKAWIEAQLEGRISLQEGKDLPGVEQLPSDRGWISSRPWKGWNQGHKHCYPRELWAVLAFVKE